MLRRGVQPLEILPLPPLPNHNGDVGCSSGTLPSRNVKCSANASVLLGGRGCPTVLQSVLTGLGTSALQPVRCPCRAAEVPQA